MFCHYYHSLQVSFQTANPAPNTWSLITKHPWILLQSMAELWKAVLTPPAASKELGEGETRIQRLPAHKPQLLTSTFPFCSRQKEQAPWFPHEFSSPGLLLHLFILFPMPGSAWSQPAVCPHSLGWHYSHRNNGHPELSRKRRFIRILWFQSLTFANVAFIL